MRRILFLLTLPALLLFVWPAQRVHAASCPLGGCGAASTVVRAIAMHRPHPFAALASGLACRLHGRPRVEAVVRRVFHPFGRFRCR